MDAVDRIEQAWRRERPDVDPGSIQLVTRVWRLARHLDRARARSLAELGSDSSTLDLLATLRRGGPPYRLTAGELHRASLLTTGAISQRLARAEREGLVRRTTAPPDRRVVQVELTARGHEVVDALFTGLMERE